MENRSTVISSNQIILSVVYYKSFLVKNSIKGEHKDVLIEDGQLKVRHKLRSVRTGQLEPKYRVKTADQMPITQQFRAFLTSAMTRSSGRYDLQNEILWTKYLRKKAKIGQFLRRSAAHGFDAREQALQRRFQEGQCPRCEAQSGEPESLDDVGNLSSASSASSGSSAQQNIGDMLLYEDPDAQQPQIEYFWLRFLLVPSFFFKIYC